MQVNSNFTFAFIFSSDPRTFNPYNLNISNWIESFKAAGVKHAVLTAKHGCGFLLWPTRTKLPDGSLYGYDISNTIHKRNVLKEFSEGLKIAGIGHGFYYSLPRNFYLNVNNNLANASKEILPGQRNVSQIEFEHIALGHLEELWSQFGNLTEIWFDGGYTTEVKHNITRLLRKYQPNAAVWNGFGISKSPLIWIGTESGHPGGDGIWSTGSHWGNGDPDSAVFCPKGVDTTLQVDDKWFYSGSNFPVRTLEDLVDVYHESVGHNGVLEMDFAIDRDGLVEQRHAIRYKEFGSWIQSCYGKAVAEVSSPPGVRSIILKIPNNTQIDRLMLQEDISVGQVIREFEVYGKLPNSNYWTFLYNNKAGIGNKKIVIFNETMMVKQFKISITKTKVKSFGAIKVSAFSPKSCELPNESIPRPTQAQLRQQSHEIVAFIVFNMATFAEDGDPGCNSDNWNKKAPNATGPT